MREDPGFEVPEIIPELSTKKILTAELVHGVPLDECVHLSQEVKNSVSKITWSYAACHMITPCVSHDHILIAYMSHDLTLIACHMM